MKLIIMKYFIIFLAIIFALSCNKKEKFKMDI